MSGGGKKATPAVTTQTIGRDPLSRFLAQNLGQQARTVNQGVPTASANIASSAEARGLADPSIDFLRRVVGGELASPEALQSEIAAASAPALREFRRTIAPNIASRFATSGRTGSGAEVSAFQDAQDVLSRNIAETASGALARERDRQTQAAGVFPQISALDRSTAEGVLQAEQTPLNRLLQVAGVLPALRTSTSTGATQATPGKGGALGSLAGGVAGSFLGPVGGAAGSALGNSLFGSGGSS